jgi:long-chain acyl-CoA synthetase
MNLAHLLERQALRAPDRPALLSGPQVVASHGEWAASAAALARRLCVAGLQPGDRVALFSRNHVRYAQWMLACWWAGLVVVPVNARLHAQELRWIVDNAQARWVIHSADVLPEGAAALPGVERVLEIDSDEASGLLAPGDPWPVTPRAPDDTAWLFYTSGTTGRPKGVMITHRNLMTMGLGYQVDVDAVAPDDAMVYAAPMSHGAGIYLVPHLMAGARHVVPASGGVDPAELFALGAAVGPLSTFAAPTIVRRLVAHAEAAGLTPDDCARAFKTIVYGGAPMYAADIQHALRVMGPRFVQIYGQGETPMVGTVLSRRDLADSGHPQHARRLASVGVAQTPVRLCVADAQGRPLPTGEVGEVLVQGDSVMAGYWRNDAATAAALRGGWLWTGDMGCLDEAGYLTLKDRSKDLVISGGSNIYPREIEEVLLEHPDVAEAAVVGEPDPEWGERIVAFVVPVPGAALEASSLDALCLSRIARFKRPKRYLVVEALPKNAYGKVLKTALREQLRAP